MLLKDILSLTLTLGWKNEKRPSGPIELDLEAGNLVHFVISAVSVQFSVFGPRKSIHVIICSRGLYDPSVEAGNQVNYVHFIIKRFKILTLPPMKTNQESDVRHGEVGKSNVVFSSNYPSRDF